MDSSPPGPVTALLLRLQCGEQEVLPELIDLIYFELRRMAAGRMNAERTGHTLTPTALVHEAYLKLAGIGELQIQNRTHFLAVAAQAMRRVLVDYARARQAERRGGGQNATPLELVDVAAPDSGDEIIALDDALSRLGKLSVRQSRVVELRYFGGLTEDEVAESLGVTRRTVNRDWQMARAWLRAEIAERRR